MSDHDEVERVPGDENLSLSRRTLLRLGLLTAAATQGPAVLRARGLRADGQARREPHRQAGRRGGRHRSRPGPQELQGGAGARRAGQGRQAPAGPGAHRPGPPRRQAPPRDRQVRRHLAPRLHGPLRHVQRPPRRPERQAPLLGLHRDQDRPQHRPGLGGQPGRQGHHALAAPRDEVERRGALHRRRLRLLVPGHVPEQGADPRPPHGDDHQRQAHHHREGGRHHHPLRRARSRTTRCPSCSRRCGASGTTPGSGATGSAASRPPTTSSSSTRSTPRSDEMAKKLAELKFETWVTMFKNRNDACRNPDLPVVTPWKTTSPLTTPTWILERNPYSVWVDTDGNQLPYIDRIRMTLGEHLEVINLRAIAGEYDSQARHIDISKLPVLLENQQKGGYRVHLDPSDQGADVALFCNQTFDKDPEIAKWLSTPRVPHRAVPRHRPPADQRDLRPRSRPDGLGGAGRADPLLPGPGVQDPARDLRRQEGQRDARQARAHQEGRRGLPPAGRRRRPPAPGPHHLRRVPARSRGSPR